MAEMLNKIKSHLGVKFFFLLASVIVLSVVPLTYLSMKAVQRYGEEVTVLNEQRIRSQAFSYLTQITHERAGRYLAIFDRIAVAAGLLGSQASAIYSDIGYYASKPLEEYTFRLHDRNGFWVNSITDPVLSGYWGGAELSMNIKRELLALTHMTPLFTQVLADNPEILADHVMSVDGIGQYMSHNQKSKENAFNLPPASEFDLRDGEPMTIFTESRDVSRDVRWTNIYKDSITDGLMLTASAPIYDKNDVFRGVAGIDVPLDNVIGDILYLGRSRWSDDIVLFSFLLDRNGKLIAFPEAYFTLFGISEDKTQLVNFRNKFEFSLMDSTVSSVRKMAHDCIGKVNYSSNLSLADGSFLVVTHRMAKLDWLLGVVVRENDMLSSIQESRIVMKSTIKTIQFKSVILALLVMCIALAIVFVAVRFLVHPLRTLAKATERVAGDNLTVSCPVTTTDEIGMLANSFNSMVGRLQVAQEHQKRYAESLKFEVEQRNIELGDKKSELEKIIKLLNKEVERRQIISEALRNSQQQYFDTLEASMAGIYIIEKGVFTYVNSSFSDMIMLTPDELIGLSPLDIICEEDHALVRKNTQRRLQGENVPPYTIKWIRKDGSTFHGEVWGRVSSWQNKPVMVGTITDVSHIKHNEKRLEFQDKQLQKSLDEKEVLLKEIYHRTKNNMLVIISLLDLQLQDIEDEKVKAVFIETESRIRAMALVHEKLYQSQNLSEIDLGDYLNDIAESLLANMVVDGRVKLVSTIESIAINIDFAIPLGLVVNEIVTNSVKHAFPGNRFGTVYLNIEKDQEGRILLTVGDNGIGLPENIDVYNSGSFGMQIIITNLVKMQLRGTLTVNRENGTSYLLSFPELKTTKRI